MTPPRSSSPARFVLSLAAALALALGTSPSGQSEEQGRGRLGPADLIEEARLLLPVYEGESKAFLTEQEEREVGAATALLDAALALDPESAYACWWKGHCEALLSENARNRGRSQEAGEHDGRALAALDRALLLDPAYYWASYARGMTLSRMDRPWDAIESFDDAVFSAQGVIDELGADDALDARQVRFKARQWRARARMRAFDYEVAREELRAFYADNGNDPWDLGENLAESYLRERDYEAAAAIYAELRASETYAAFPMPHERLGYIRGLTGDREAASALLRDALEQELQPGLYIRMWRWILAEGDVLAEARNDLQEFLRTPPSTLSSWDRALGAFVLGAGTAEEFLATAQAERSRRMKEAQPLDDILCEAWFYIGLRHELDARTAGTKPLVEHLQDALDSYRRALGYRPRPFKWEWEYARLHFARLADRLGLPADPGFRIEQGRLGLHGAAALQAAGVTSGTVERLLWHVAGEPRGTEGLESYLEHEARPGELLRCVIRSERGSLEAVTLVVDARGASGG